MPTDQPNEANQFNCPKVSKQVDKADYDQVVSLQYEKKYYVNFEAMILIIWKSRQF